MSLGFAVIGFAVVSCYFVMPSFNYCSSIKSNFCVVAQNSNPHPVRTGLWFEFFTRLEFVHRTPLENFIEQTLDYMDGH